jgi:hypothetical protein
MKKTLVSSAKRLSKRLHLNKETLVTLDVGRVVGGSETRGFTNCEYCNSYTIQIPSDIPGGSC